MSLALAFESIEDHLPESVVWEGVELYINIFSELKWEFKCTRIGR